MQLYNTYGTVRYELGIMYVAEQRIVYTAVPLPCMVSVYLVM